MATSPLSVTTSLHTFSLSLPKQSKPFLVSPQSQVAYKRFDRSFGLRNASFIHPDFQRSNVGSTKAGGCGGALTATPKKKVEVFDAEEELATSLANYVVDLSAKFVKQRGAFSIALSGGSLIQSLRKLVEPPFIDSIEWSKWHIFWVDERVVPKDHVDSNYKLAFDGLLSKVPILLSNVYPINDALSAERAAEDYETRLKSLIYTKVIDTSTVSGLPKFDLILLGMGPDGHVASLFPGHPVVKEQQKWVAYIKDSPKPPPQRITFTFPLINAASNIALVVSGSAQANAVRDALRKSQISETLPVKMVSPEGELKWFLDNDAAF